MAPLHIPVLLGTQREGRRSEDVARWIVSELEKRNEITTTLLDVQEILSSQEGKNRYTKEIVASDALVIVTPEYNHGYPGELKTVLDLLYEEYLHKAAGIVGVSSGSFGGSRMTEQLLGVLREIGLVTIKKTLYISNVVEVFEKGNIKDPTLYEKRFGELFEELRWMTTALKEGRTRDH